jgi:hypothetical protein
MSETTMQTYGSIITVWERDPATRNKTLIENAWATDEIALLASEAWEWTEKVDGVNIRVGWDGEGVSYRGKNEGTQIPPFLLEKLAFSLPADVFREAELPPMVVYGEGYGAKIQKHGKRYIPGGVDLIVFDVLCGGLWLERSNVLDIAGKLRAHVVPVLGTDTLLQAVELVRAGFGSRVAHDPALLGEGLVLRPPHGLLTRRGHRIITKVKHRDFAKARGEPK